MTELYPMHAHWQFAPEPGDAAETVVPAAALADSEATEASGTMASGTIDATVLDGGTFFDDTAAALSWQERSLCAQTDPEAFFPEKGGSTREAKRICTVCPVRQECLEYALEHDERFGIWGGLSERERRRLKRRVS